MSSLMNKSCVFEQGPIRPPSESDSLLIRVTRNCPWNKCLFCSVYKNSTFSVRSITDIKNDIDIISDHISDIKCMIDESGLLIRQKLIDFQRLIPNNKQESFYAALNWYINGTKSIFLQDANSLIIRPDNLIDILKYIKAKFPLLKRITSYARSHTIARIRPDNLVTMKLSGLNRIHIGLESGSNKVLNFIKKGCDKAMHIKAGTAVKNSGIELSEYFMPGLGGKGLSHEHALESADTINKINPDFIRLRTLYVPQNSKLFNYCESGKFQKCSALEIALEIKLFIEKLDGITSILVSDHMLNLFEEISGKLPEAKKNMLSILNQFIGFTSYEQCLYQVGKRIGVFKFIKDMSLSEKLKKVDTFCQNNDINSENVDMKLDLIIKNLF